MVAFLIGGCAHQGPERTLTYRVPQFEYEQHDPQFSHQPSTINQFQLAPSVSAPIGTVTNVTLSWDYPANELSAIRAFKVYSHTNINVSPTNWPVIAQTTNLQVVVPMQPQMRFFYVTSSNFWGESLPSNWAGTPQPPRLINTTTIEPGP